MYVPGPSPPPLLTPHPSSELLPLSHIPLILSFFDLWFSFLSAGKEFRLDQVAEALAEHNKPARAGPGAGIANKCMLRS